MSAVHQFSRLGCHAFIGGCSAVDKDVPPYIKVSGNYAKPYGLNSIGLSRRGFSEQSLKSLKSAYRLLYRSALLTSVAIERIRTEVADLPEIRHFLEFVENSERGICR